VLEFATKFCT